MFAATDGETDLVIGARHLDRYEKCHGTWKFTTRAIATDWAHVHDPSTIDVSHPLTRGTTWGRLGPEGPSHEFFSLL